MKKSEHPVVDFLYNIALRAKELADKKMNDLRVIASSSETRGGAIAEHRGASRGELIETILTDEFDLDAERIEDDYA